MQRHIERSSKVIICSYQFCFILKILFILLQVFQAHPLQSHDPIIITVSNLTDTVTTESIAASINVSVLDDNMTTTEVPDEEVTGQPNTALLSLILTLGTFSIAYFLRQFRNSQFLGRSVSCVSRLCFNLLIYVSSTLTFK